VPVLALNKTEVYRTRQLLINYAYGNPNSNVLLVTYGPTVNFINHDSHRPNVRLQWSSHPYHKEEMLEASPKDLFKKGFGMLMELVALRDINPGEEILMDYGSGWEEAWMDFVAEWKATPDSEEYVPSYDLNNDSMKDGARYHIVRDAEEQKTDPYPKSVMTACFYSNSAGEPLQATPAEVPDGVKKTVELTYQGPSTDCLRPCQILSREETTNGKGRVTYLYKAEMMDMINSDDEDCVLNSDERHIVSKIPRAGIRFIHQPGSTDQHLQNSFRHPIELPDTIWPKAWLHDDKLISETGISPGG